MRSVDSADEAPAARSVVAVLGASNVARGLPSLIATIKERERAPNRELWVACGHGRSYGLSTSFLGRTLPGLLGCGIWRRLEGISPDADDTQLAVVLTDIGNDLVYGVEPSRLVVWVRTCLDRLPAQARVTVVAPPLASLATVSALRFAVLRALFFPTHAVRRTELRGALQELGRDLRELTADPRVRLVEPPARWYGLDPIHYLRHSRREAWRELLGATGADASGALAWRDLALASWARPESWTLFGIPLTSARQSYRLDDGTLLSLY